MLFFTHNSQLCVDELLLRLKISPGIRQKNFLSVLLFISVHFMTANAQNLVPNPSFESVNCPTLYEGWPDQIERYVHNWYTANCGSPDVMAGCSNSTTGLATRPPDILFGHQYARTGDNFIGISHYGFTDYIGTQLTEPLEANEAYEVKFYVSIADGTRFLTDNIGMHFSTTKIWRTAPKCLTGAWLNYTPQVRSTPGVFINEYEDWYEISGIYIASGGEEYIVIGCFFLYNATTSPHVLDLGANQKVNPNFPGTSQGRISFYLDDVSVEKISILPIKLLSFEGKSTTEGIHLDWKTVSEINNCHFEIQRGEHPGNFTTIGSLDGAINSTALEEYTFTDRNPLSTTAYYRLKQVDCDGKSEYSKIISIEGTAPRMIIHPNPVSDKIRLNWDKPGIFEVSIWNTAGQEVIAPQKYNEQAFDIEVSGLNPGIYLLKAVHNGHSYTEKIIKR